MNTNCNCGGHHHHEHNDCGCGGHEHEHHGCGCGGHEHEHHGCGCGEHEHEHHSCGCGEHNHHEPHEHTHQIPRLTSEEIEFLNVLKDSGKLPIARYMITSTKTDHFIVPALAPVYITKQDETMDEVKSTAELLQVLYEDGFIDFAHGDALENFDYSVYENSETFKYFVETIDEVKNKPDFLGDTAVLEKGFMQLTYEGDFTLEANLNITENQ